MVDGSPEGHALNAKIAAGAATILWGFTYVLSTQMLPHNPMFIAAVRALGGGILLLLISREVFPRAWWGKLLVLGTLNSGLFFALLFVSALRLPGGVAATFQALGPLFMVLLAWPLLGAIPAMRKVLAVVLGAVGVALVVLKGDASIDMIGVMAALGSALSIALGGILVHNGVGQNRCSDLPRGSSSWRVSNCRSSLPSSMTFPQV
jgi:probable blue pigment (indigoidine) exporter